MAQVPATSIESTSLGDVAEFTIPFPFLSRAEVFVTVDGAVVPFTWINDGLVQLATIPELGAVVRRYRSTAAYVPLHQFSTGVPFLPRYVDRDFKQTLYAVQESVNETAGTAAQALATAEESLLLVQDAFDILGARTQYMVKGPYGPGLLFETTSEVFSYLGEFYAPGPGLSLPYTTTGVGAGEIANFRSVGDAILRQDLLAPTGGTLVAYKGRTVYDRLADEFHPQDFAGATDQLKLQACLDAAAAAGTGVVLDKNYTIESIRLRIGLKYITGGQLTCNSAVSLEAVIEVDGAFYGGFPCDNVVIDKVVIDGGGVAPRGVFGHNALGVKVINCHIFNLFATDANGVAFAEGSDNCVVANNLITMPVISVDASLSFGVYIYGAYNTQRNLDAFNGYATLGAMPRTPNPASHNIVTGNIIENGYYSVALDGVLDCQVSGNHCLSPHWRGIALTDAWDCSITGNPVRNFGTNGIHLSYGTLNTTVIGNTLVRTGANTAGNYEGAIQAYIDCHSNKIANNSIQSTNRFGIYLGLDVSNNTIQDNEVVGATLAGIALESEWDAAKPGGAIYSRVSVSLAAAQPTFGNVVKGNQLRVVSGAASIAASSLNTVDFRDNDISDNTYANISNHDMYFFAENAGSFYRNTLKKNTLIGAVGDAAKYVFSAGRGMFKEVSGNSVLNGTVGVTAFPALATTPDVATADFWSALYGSAATITNFLGGADGQEFTLRGNGNVTIQNNANIVLKGGVNATFSGAVGLMRFQKIQGTWLETYRNF